MTDRELLELLVQKVTGMEQEMRDMEQGMRGMEQGMRGMEQGMRDMKQEMRGMEQGMRGMEQGMQDMEQGMQDMEDRIQGIENELQDIKASQVRMEQDHGTKITALFDGYALRGDQIKQLQDHLDERLDAIHTDLSYVVGKIAQHDRKLIQLSKAK